MIRNYMITAALTLLFTTVTATAQKNNSNSTINAVTPAQATEPVADDEETLEILKENRTLNKQIKEANKELDDLKKEFDELNKKYEANVTKNITPLKQEIKTLKAQRDSLTKIISSAAAGQQALVDAKADEMQQIIDSLSRELIAATKATATLTDENTQLKQGNAQLENEIKQYEVFKRDYINNLADIYDRNWASKPFSLINGTDLDNAIADCERYATEDTRIKDAADKLNTLKAQNLTYNHGIQQINSQYDRKEVINAIAQITRIKGNVSTVRTNELNDLYNKLIKYRDATKSFQSLIQNIDKAIADFDTHNESYPMAEIELGSDENTAFINAINTIPWLRQQYDSYLQALKKDCKGHNEARETILNINAQ